MTRKRWRSGVGLLAAAATGAIMLALGACSGGQQPASTDGAPAIAGLRAELVEAEQALDDGRVSWSVQWRMCWTPVPGVAEYLVTVVSFEGAAAPRAVTDTCYQLSVASGTAERPGERPGLPEQLDLMSTSLSVSVAARASDGTVGPPGPDIAVGETYP